MVTDGQSGGPFYSLPSSTTDVRARQRQSLERVLLVFLHLQLEIAASNLRRTSEAINPVCTPKGLPLSCSPDGHQARSGILATCILDNYSMYV